MLVLTEILAFCSGIIFTKRVFFVKGVKAFLENAILGNGHTFGMDSNTQQKQTCNYILNPDYSWDDRVLL